MKKLGRPRKLGPKKVNKEPPPQHLSDEDLHSPDEHSDSGSKKSSAEDEIDDKQFSPGSILEVMDFNEQW